MTEIDSRTPLQLEQLKVQANKLTYRRIGEYDREIFSPWKSGVANFLGSKAAGATTMTELLDGLPASGEDGVHWADMAGGVGIAMRQAAAMQRAGRLGEARLTNVDLFDWVTELEGYQLRALTWATGVDLGDKETAPDLILGDAAQTELPEPADLITSVHGIQYLDDPLGAVANWYNQLSDDGLMVVSKGSAVWSTAISAEGISRNGDPFRNLFNQFEEQAVSYAIDNHDNTHGNSDKRREEFSALAIQKQAGTRLLAHASPITRDMSTVGNKFVRYDDAHPAIELVAA